MNITSIRKCIDGRCQLRYGVRAKMLLHVWSYVFYDTTLFTEQQRRHMIKIIMSDNRTALLTDNNTSVLNYILSPIIEKKKIANMFKVILLLHLYERRQSKNKIIRN